MLNQLHNAAGLRHDINAIKEYLGVGLDVNEKNEAGMTALMLSAYYGHNDVVHLLVENGADLNTQNVTGKTALDRAIMGWAMYSHNTRIVRILTSDSGDRTAISDVKLETFAFVAAQDHVSVINFLIQNGAKNGTGRENEILDVILTT